MIPNTELMPEAIPVLEHVTECPRCASNALGDMITLSLQYCTHCNTWLRYARGTRRQRTRSTDQMSN